MAMSPDEEAYCKMLWEDDGGAAHELPSDAVKALDAMRRILEEEAAQCCLHACRAELAAFRALSPHTQGLGFVFADEDGTPVRCTVSYERMPR